MQFGVVRQAYRGLAGGGCCLSWVPRTTLASCKAARAVGPNVEPRGRGCNLGLLGGLLAVLAGNVLPAVPGLLCSLVKPKTSFKVIDRDMEPRGGVVVWFSRS